MCLKKWFLILFLFPCSQLQAQSGPCILKDPIVNIDFGRGEASELNVSSSYSYRRVETTCPSDGHYTYTPYTSDCFRGDWITLNEDHTAGDQLGNMMVFNASYRSGEFFSTMVRGLTPGKIYEFAIWMLNVCKPSEKCPYPLLPNITIRLETVTGKLVTQMNTGDLQRYGRAQWTKYNIMFTLPAGINSLALSMVNHNPGGCGNDFAMDDITFRECVPPPPRAPVITKKTTTNPIVKKPTPATTTKTNKPPPPKKQATTSSVIKPDLAKAKPIDSASLPKVKSPGPAFRPPPPPVALRTRTNSLVKKIEAEPGDIIVNLYDNGEIDGDTVTIYHNNVMILSRARLSQKPLTIKIAIDVNNPHHELVMVANNLGSIPPNTSLMVVTAGTKRYEVFISSNEQNNAKVVFDLKE
jgi:hypothetical protein